MTRALRSCWFIKRREALDAITNVRRLARRSHLHSCANFKGLWLRFNLLVTTLRA
jgi:hypothetical protein